MIDELPALAGEVDGPFIDAFVRATRPAAAAASSCCALSRCGGNG